MTKRCHLHQGVVLEIAAYMYISDASVTEQLLVLTTAIFILVVRTSLLSVRDVRDGYMEPSGIRRDNRPVSPGDVLDATGRYPIIHHSLRVLYQVLDSLSTCTSPVPPL